MTVNVDGAIVASDLYRANVHNRAKLAYGAVSAWLEGTGPAPPNLAAVAGLDDQLRLQDRTAQALRQVRHRRGALRLETLEPRAVFEDGVLADLRPDEKNRARELIEDFMIAANGITAKYLARNGYASLRRVLRSPERWERIVALAAGLGEKLPPEPDAVALDAFLAKRRDADPSTFGLSLTIVKLLGKGECRAARPAQRGISLAVRDYTHATALNRRWPDLIAQRVERRWTATAPRRRACRAGAALEDNQKSSVAPSAAALMRGRASASGSCSSGHLRGDVGPHHSDGRTGCPGSVSTSAMQSRSSSCVPTLRAATSTSHSRKTPDEFGSAAPPATRLPQRGIPR
jgi:exoribonuclease R